MTHETDLNSDGKPRFRLADDEDIANMSAAFTLPGRLAKQLADRQKFREQQQAQDHAPQDPEDSQDISPAKS